MSRKSRDRGVSDAMSAHFVDERQGALIQKWLTGFADGSERLALPQLLTDYRLQKRFEQLFVAE